MLSETGGNALRTRRELLCLTAPPSLPFQRASDGGDQISFQDYGRAWPGTLHFGGWRDQSAILCPSIADFDCHHHANCNGDTAEDAPGSKADSNPDCSPASGYLRRFTANLQCV